MDELAVAETEMTGHYLTIDLACNNKQQDVHPLPQKYLNEEIITLMHTKILSCPDLPLQAQKSYLFPGINKALLSIGKL